MFIPTYRRRFVLAVAMQTIAQWSGGNGITYYIPSVRLVLHLSPPAFSFPFFFSYYESPT